MANLDWVPADMSWNLDISNGGFSGVTAKPLIFNSQFVDINVDPMAWVIPAQEPDGPEVRWPTTLSDPSLVPRMGLVWRPRAYYQDAQKYRVNYVLEEFREAHEASTRLVVELAKWWLVKLATEDGIREINLDAATVREIAHATRVLSKLVGVANVTSNTREAS